MAIFCPSAVAAAECFRPQKPVLADAAFHAVINQVRLSAHRCKGNWLDSKSTWQAFFLDSLDSSRVARHVSWAGPPLKAAEDTTLGNLLDTAGLDRPRRDDLLARMTGAARHYHTLAHLSVLWRWHCQLHQEAGFHTAADARLSACAIAYHDAVFVPGAQDNEALSAVLWRQSAPAELQPAEVDWVAGTILCTARHLAELPAEPPGTGVATPGLRQWVVDLDLMPLAEAPSQFGENAALLKAEWTGGDADTAERKQRAFLRELHVAPRIYRTPLLHRNFEAAARANIAAALAASP